MTKNWSIFHCSRVVGMVLALAASMVFSGCETPAPANQTQVAPKDMTINQDLLRAGERIRIIYLDIPDAPTPTEQQIPESGKLTLPKGVEVMFANKLKTDVEKEIQDIYVNQRRLYPRMTVNIERQGLTVSIGGEVRTPGSVLHSGQMTVTRAINAAGGFTEFALHSDVVITRAISGQQIHVNVDKALKKPALDVPVYPGDSVLVRRRIL